MRCLWTLVGDGGTDHRDSTAFDEDGADPALPDGSPELIFCQGDPFEHVRADGIATRQPHAFLVGQITAPLVVRPTGRVALIAVRFEAHGAALACDDVGRLTNAWLPIDRLPPCGLGELAESLQRARSIEAGLAAVSRWLQQVIRTRPLPDDRVVAAVRAIRQSDGAVDLDALCRTLTVSPRTLQRRFARQVGISPKQLARIVRFQRVFRAWRTDAHSLARVAAECGYFDQSHLIRDFRDFAGAAPAGFLAELPPFTAQFIS